MMSSQSGQYIIEFVSGTVRNILKAETVSQKMAERQRGKRNILQTLNDSELLQH